MQLDGVVFAKSKMSAPSGYLRRESNGDVTFTKYKSQGAGRMHILIWLIYKLVMAFKKDKLLLTLEAHKIIDAIYQPGVEGGFMNFGAKYGELQLITADNEVYKFMTHPDELDSAFHNFVAAVKPNK